MTTFDFIDLRNELSNLLRSNDILTISIRGVATKTDTFTATSGQTLFTLTGTKPRNIRTITVDGNSKYYLRDYTVNWATGVVTLLTGAVEDDAVVINYDYGSTDKIYPDLPRDDLTLTSYPRVGIELVNVKTEPYGIGGMVHMSEVLISVNAWVSVNKDTNVASGFGGLTDLSGLIENIRNVIRVNAKSLYTVPYVTPVGLGPLIQGTNMKIMQQNAEFTAKFKVE